MARIVGQSGRARRSPIAAPRECGETMFGFVKSFVASSANPIGVDFGSDCLRMAQVQIANGEPRIIAAASADVPSHVRNDANARASFVVETARDLLSPGGFKGTRAVLA